MKVIATTVLYDNIPRVVQVDISSHDEEDARYIMNPQMWANIESGYAEQWDCIVEYRRRHASQDEIDSVSRVIQEWQRQHIEADLTDSGDFGYFSVDPSS